MYSHVVIILTKVIKTITIKDHIRQHDYVWTLVVECPNQQNHILALCSGYLSLWNCKHIFHSMFLFCLFQNSRCYWVILIEGHITLHALVHDKKNCWLMKLQILGHHLFKMIWTQSSLTISSSFAWFWLNLLSKNYENVKFQSKVGFVIQFMDEYIETNI
jgi:hypothetical protein